MKITRYSMFAGAALLMVGAPLMRAQDAGTQPAAGMNGADVNAAIEQARADARADRVTIINQNMKFTNDESANFWPIYHRYENDAMKLNDEKVALVKEYAAKSGSLSDADAKNITDRWVNLQGKQLELDKKYYEEFNKKLPPATTTRFFQLEHRMNLVTDLQISAALPMTLKSPAGPGGQ